MTFDKFDNNKKKLLEGLRKYRGIITNACQFAGLDRQTFYNYKSDDEEFAKAVEDISEEALDFVEGKLFEKINGWDNAVLTKEGYVAYDQPPSDTAIIFYLKTKGRKRGYIEKSEVTNTNLNINVSPTEEEAKIINEALEKKF